MAKKFELKKSVPASEVAHHPVVITEDDEDTPVRGRGARPKFSRLIPVERIHPNPWQARRQFDQAKLDELAAGLREHGWIGGGLPVRQHPTQPGEYQLVFGERRWRAARLADLTAIPCEVSSFSDDDMVEIGLLENIQREDLTRYEEGVAYQNLLALRDEGGRPRYSIRSLAQRLGKDKSYIEDRLRYARAPEDVQQLVQTIPDLPPRMVHELAHVKDQSVREALIEAVQQHQVDIEGLKFARQQLDVPSADGATVSDQDVQDVSATEAKISEEEAVSSSSLSPVDASWLTSARLRKDDRRISKILQGWANLPDTDLDESVRSALLVCVRGWEQSLVQIRRAWRLED